CVSGVGSGVGCCCGRSCSDCCGSCMSDHHTKSDENQCPAEERSCANATALQNTKLAIITDQLFITNSLPVFRWHNRGWQTLNSRNPVPGLSEQKAQSQGFIHVLHPRGKNCATADSVGRLRPIT